MYWGFLLFFHFEDRFELGFVFWTFLLMGSEKEGESKTKKDPGETGEVTGNLYRVGLVSHLERPLLLPTTLYLSATLNHSFSS